MTTVINAADHLTLEHFTDEGLNELSDDNECCRISFHIDEIALQDLKWNLQGTEDLALYWRDRMRKKFEARIVFKLKCRDDPSLCEEFNDLDSALDAAYDIAYRMAEEQQDDEDDKENIDIDFYNEGDFNWGAGPVGSDGAYWPYIQAFVNGDKIKKLPWNQQ